MIHVSMGDEQEILRNGALRAAADVEGNLECGKQDAGLLTADGDTFEGEAVDFQGTSGGAAKLGGRRGRGGGHGLRQGKFGGSSGNRGLRGQFGGIGNAGQVVMEERGAETRTDREGGQEVRRSSASGEHDVGGIRKNAQRWRDRRESVHGHGPARERESEDSACLQLSWF